MYLLLDLAELPRFFSLMKAPASSYAGTMVSSMLRACWSLYRADGERSRLWPDWPGRGPGWQQHSGTPPTNPRMRRSTHRWNANLRPSTSTSRAPQASAGPTFHRQVRGARQPIRHLQALQIAHWRSCRARLGVACAGGSASCRCGSASDTLPHSPSGPESRWSCTRC